MKTIHFFWFSFFYALSILYLTITTPITPYEAQLLYGSKNLAQTFMVWGNALIDSFVGLRLYTLFFGALSIGLFYILSQNKFTTLVFMLLPGVMIAVSMANMTIIVLPLVLLFVLAYQRGFFWILPIVMFFLFVIDETSILFFIATLLFGVFNKIRFLTTLSATFLIAFLILSKGIEIKGDVFSGHFVDIFGLYASIFSPFLFLYFFYTLYRIALREKKELIWYIAFTAFITSLLLSISQKVNLDDYAPYVLPAILVMLDLFYRTIGVRLPKFRHKYKMGLYIIFGFLVIGATVTVLHQPLYYSGIFPQKKHFAHTIYRVYENARYLKSQHRTCIDGDIKKSEILQYRYYQLPPCKEL